MLQARSVCKETAESEATESFPDLCCNILLKTNITLFKEK